MLAFHVTPGKVPDVDLWHFEGGFQGLPPFRCSPEPAEGGWELSSCTGIRGLPEGTKLNVFVPESGDIGLEVKFQLGPFTFPISLTRLRQRDEPQASANLSLVWHEPGEGVHSDIWAADGLVFAPRFDAIIEILDAKSGQLLGTASVAELAEGKAHTVLDVKARDGILYAATVSDGVVVFDVSQPSSPKLIGQYYVFDREGSPENFTNIHNIYLSPDGKLLYAINQSLVSGPSRTAVPFTDLRVLDVSDPASPVEVGRFAIETDVGIAHDVNVIERDGRLLAFMNHLRAGLCILDVTDPASIGVLPSVIWDGTVSHSGWPFTLDDKLYYAHTDEGYDQHLTILEVTDLENPKVLSRFSTRQGISIHNVQVVEGIAYISYYIDGLRVVDLRDPENPREVGHFDTVPVEDERDIFQGAFGVRVFEGLVYVSDIETGTYAFRVDLD